MYHCDLRINDGTAVLIVDMQYLNIQGKHTETFFLLNCKLVLRKFSDLNRQGICRQAKLPY